MKDVNEFDIFSQVIRGHDTFLNSLAGIFPAACGVISGPIGSSV